MALSKEKLALVMTSLTKMNPKDLAHCESLIKERRHQMKQVETSKFQTGQKVSISHKRGDKTIVGKVAKLNKYTVVVQGNDGETHRVSPDILEAV